MIRTSNIKIRTRGLKAWTIEITKTTNTFLTTLEENYKHKHTHTPKKIIKLF